MSLDVHLIEMRPTAVFDCNITHNLGQLAGAVDLYRPLWRPEEIGVTRANELAPFLKRGLERLRDRDRREEFRKLEPANGWGNFDNLVEFVEQYLAACEENPDALVQVSR